MKDCPGCGNSININVDGFIIMGRKEIECPSCKKIVIVTCSIGF